MAYEIVKIDKLEFDGPKRFEYVERQKHMYLIQRDNWRYKYKIKLPHWDTILEFGKPQDLRILCCKMNVYIKFKNSYWMNFFFKSGFITDLASVPWFLRGIVDNDDHKIVQAALVHDFLFSTNRLPFKIANSLFYKMLLTNGYNRFKALLAFWAVSSPIGRKLYRSSKNKQDRLQLIDKAVFIWVFGRDGADGGYAIGPAGSIWRKGLGMIPMFIMAHAGASLLIAAVMDEWGADVDVVYLTVAAFNAALLLFEAVTLKGFDP